MKKQQPIENAPLLYIVQPNLGPKTCYMQKSFRWQSDKKRRNVKGAETSFPSPTFASFREMELEEQLHFLANLPEYLRPVKCKLTTKQRSYEGFVDQYESRKVVFQAIQKGRKITIPVEQVISVSLIGLPK
ncbi:spore coat protein CotO [Thermolongibacillus altinsuensis]|uniref:Spore coat protein CotO n=1 Tax=Thermolongibacillus altinsuensis TaxID=575256 RepID=A0A4R1QJ10_9BACL|nr:CotO family spore coat protein [Thermolongibacillus altinsuensis]TCL50990.1 spore coat protein CotO [Thermolongibacillus altinsuensis]GMB08940.1 hypothetical protein B1no1_16500 [Thermolongibacillus altinsuensis]